MYTLLNEAIVTICNANYRFQVALSFYQNTPKRRAFDRHRSGFETLKPLKMERSSSGSYCDFPGWTPSRNWVVLG